MTFPFMLKKIITPTLPLAIAMMVGAPQLAASGTRPSLQVTVQNGANDLQVSAGSVLSISARATDSDGDLKEHWLEIQKPDTVWSWEGWLTEEPWGPQIVGSGSASTKATTFTFTEPGTYLVRSTAIDAEDDDWRISNTIQIKVSESENIPEPTPAIGAAPAAPVAPVRPVVRMTVANSTSGPTVTTGTTLAVSGKATDGDGDMIEHWLEVRKPSGVWSWSGWLTSEPWAGALVGSAFSSTKTGTFTFTDVGTYALRTTAIDRLGNTWIISNEILVRVTAATTPPAPAPVVPPVVPVPSPAPPTPVPVDAAPTSSIVNGDGSVNRTAYLNYVATWTRDSVSFNLGPRFEDLNPGAADTRPLLFKQTSRVCTTSYSNKVNPFELGPPQGCYPDTDYWSEAGQLAYVPDNPATDPGLDRIQVFAYYDNVFALSPRLDWPSTRPHPDWQATEPSYIALLGGVRPKNPIANVRGYGMLQNEALILYQSGLLAVAGTQTSREGGERPYPGFVFPSTKVPTGLAVTASNEFALVTIWDTVALRGQLAVVALEGKYLAFHTWPHMGLPNQGSFSSMKLLGYIDLPMATPTSVAAASNGYWNGPSQTANKVLSQINLADDATREGLNSGDLLWRMVIADKGYAVVASKHENKAAIVDLTPLFAYVRQSYLSSSSSFRSTVSNRGNGPGQWPLTFSENPGMKPTIVWQQPVTKPTAVLAGVRLDRWSTDFHKAYIAQQDGTIQIVNTSSLMARFSWEKKAPLAIAGTVKVGRNPVSLCFTRFIDRGLPLIPSTSAADPLNNTFYVACRGDREINAVVTFGGRGAVYRRIRDKRMGDPVGVSVAGRGNILSVADFSGRKLLSFRIGAIVDRSNRYWGCGPDGKAPFEFAGEISFSGYPIAVSSANVN